MGKSTISMAIFNSYFDIIRGYPNQGPLVRQDGIHSNPEWFPGLTAPLGFYRSKGPRPFVNLALDVSLLEWKYMDLPRIHLFLDHKIRMSVLLFLNYMGDFISNGTLNYDLRKNEWTYIYIYIYIYLPLRYLEITWDDQYWTADILMTACPKCGAVTWAGIRHCPAAVMNLPSLPLELLLFCFASCTVIPSKNQQQKPTFICCPCNYLLLL